LVTWITDQYLFLAIPLIAGILGLLFGFNPIMWIAKRFLRKKPSEYTPEDWDQQQFNQTIAVICLTLGLIGYKMHWMVLAYFFTIMVAFAAFLAILGFCIGCYIRYKWLMYRTKNALK
jgi:hypothetical protein